MALDVVTDHRAVEQVEFCRRASVISKIRRGPTRRPISPCRAADWLRSLDPLKSALPSWVSSFRCCPEGCAAGYAQTYCDVSPSAPSQPLSGLESCVSLGGPSFCVRVSIVLHVLGGRREKRPVLENGANDLPGSIADVRLAPHSHARVYDFAGLGKQAAMISILATAYFLTAAVGAHIVETQYNVFSDYISDYAIGPGDGSTDRRSWRPASDVSLSLAPLSCGSVRGIVEDRRCIAGCRRRHLRDRLRLSDGSPSSRSTANDNSRRDSLGGCGFRLRCSSRLARS